MRTFPIVAILIAIASVATSRSAQDKPYTLRVDVPYVSVDVAVLDGDGRPMPNLRIEDFSVSEDGQPQKVVSFSPVTDPYSILLLFDRSASTKGEQVFMQRALRAFLEGLRPQDRAAVAGFDESFRMLAAWGSNQERITSAMAGLSAGETAGETNLYQSLVRAVEREFRETSGRRAVVVLTDGRDSRHYKQTVKEERVTLAASDTEFKERLEALRRARVPVYFIAVNTDRNLGKSPGGDYLNLQRVFGSKGLDLAFLEETRKRMERMAEVTGGSVLYPETMESVASVYARVRADLTTSYSLGYVSTSVSSSPTADRYRSIVVKVTKPNAVVRQSREGYAAP
jgi:VWFA-related protein